MKKITFLFILIVSYVSSSRSQTLECDAFCVLNITFDNINHQLDVTVLNGNSDAVNYPIVQVTNANGDTVANINGLFYYFAQLGGDTVIHKIPTTLTSLSAGFTGTVYIKDGSSNNACSVSYPSACTVGVNELASNNTITIYPNPAQNDIHIDLGELNNRQAQINFFDNTGRLAKSYIRSSNQLIINRNGLNNGIYFIVVTIENKRLTSKLVIK